MTEPSTILLVMLSSRTQLVMLILYERGTGVICEKQIQYIRGFISMKKTCDIKVDLQTKARLVAKGCSQQFGIDYVF